MSSPRQERSPAEEYRAEASTEGNSVGTVGASAASNQDSDASEATLAEETEATAEAERSPCAICQQVDREDRVMLQCTHNFDRSCITTWLARNNSCPTCRIPANGVIAGVPDSIRRQVRFTAVDESYRSNSERSDRGLQVQLLHFHVANDSNSEGSGSDAESDADSDVERSRIVAVVVPSSPSPIPQWQVESSPLQWTPPPPHRRQRRQAWQQRARPARQRQRRARSARQQRRPVGQERHRRRRCRR